MNFRPDKKLINVAVHVLVWGIIIVMPFLSDRQIPYWAHVRGFTPFYVSIIIFYVNYFIFIDRFLFTNKIWQFIILNFILFAFCFFLVELIIEMIPEPQGRWSGKRPRKWPIGLTITRNLISFILTTGASIAVKSISRITKLESVRTNLEKEKLQAEITGLKQQIHPHFLFNTLNNIYAQIGKSPDEAQDSVHKLSKMLRYLLYETDADFVPLEGEIGFLKNYIELMNLRLGKNVQVETEFSTSTPELTIAPLLLLPLIENAYKHGISSTEKSFIHIYLGEKSRELYFNIDNSNFPKHGEDRVGSGIGLDNFRKRLELLYPEKHYFNPELVSGVYKVKLRIDL